MELIFIFMMFYYKNYVVVGLILQKLYSNKLSSHFRIELREKLNGFQNLLVLSLSLEKKLSMTFLLPKVSFLYFRPNLLA